jgi:predicted regulator of Ras-like GTPase activity (Roadblock/LC7/MglB family)
MNFREVLERVCSRVEGALGAVIIAEDGIVVERHILSAAADLDLASVEFVAAAREVKRASEAAQAGELEEMAIASEAWITLLRRVGPGYYLLLFMDPKGLLGRGRYELRRAAVELAPEFD